MYLPIAEHAKSKTQAKQNLFSFSILLTVFWFFYRGNVLNSSSAEYCMIIKFSILLLESVSHKFVYYSCDLTEIIAE